MSVEDPSGDGAPGRRAARWSGRRNAGSFRPIPDEHVEKHQARMSTLGFTPSGVPRAGAGPGAVPETVRRAGSAKRLRRQFGTPTDGQDSPAGAWTLWRSRRSAACRWCGRATTWYASSDRRARTQRSCALRVRRRGGGGAEDRLQGRGPRRGRPGRPSVPGARGGQRWRPRWARTPGWWKSMLSGVGARGAQAGPNLLIVEHRLGYVMANAGVDQSNVAPQDGVARALLLPGRSRCAAPPRCAHGLSGAVRLCQAWP